MDDDKAGDQRLPHKQDPNIECTTARLAELGMSCLNRCML